MNRNQRRMAAYNARKATEHIERDNYTKRIDRAFTKLSLGCTAKVARATSSPSLRDKQEGGGVCLPEIAIYNAGYRTVRKNVVHITK